MVVQHTADCVVGMLEQFSSSNQFHRCALIIEERDACEGCDVLVRRLTAKIAKDGFIERLVGFPYQSDRTRVCCCC